MIGAPKDMWGVNAFRILVDQVGRDHALFILDIPPALFGRYLRGSVRVPRGAVLALYWESNWGRAQIGAHYQTEAGYLRNDLAALKRENARLRASIEHLMRIGDFGGATNDAIQL
jgi:hypothetical protein